MVLSADLTFRAKWTNTIMSSSGLLRSFKSIPNCSWNAVWGPSSHHRMGSGHGWDDDGDSDVSVIIVVVSGSEPGDLSEIRVSGSWSISRVYTHWMQLAPDHCTMGN